MKKNIVILFMALCCLCSNAQTTKITICNGDSVLFYGRYYNSAGTYPYSKKVIDHIDTIVGYNNMTFDTIYRDSIIDILHLTIQNPVVTTKYINSCIGERVDYNGKSYTSSTTIYDTLKTFAGCDSILKIVITFNGRYQKSKSAAICEGDYYTFGKKKLTKPGVYIDSMKSVDGCDSIIILNLTVYNSFRENIYDTICTGMSYSWRGQTFYTSGSHADKLRTSHGCDSIYYLNLEVLPFISVDVYNSICTGDTCHFYGKDYTTSGNYNHKVSNLGGCDTIYTLHLTVNNDVYLNLNETICENSYYSWAGKRYTQPGVYYDTLPGFNGECDTVSTLTLTVLPTSFTTINQDICPETSIIFNNQTINKSGVYYDTLNSIYGCDSIIRMIVSVKPSFLHQDTSYVCNGDSIIFFNTIIKEDGIYTADLKTVDGCDSIYKKTVIILRADTTNIIVHQCNGIPYNFYGQLITKPGKYLKKLTNNVGCDSVIRLIYDTVPYYFREQAHICEGETYNFHNKIVSTQGKHYVTFKSRTGCDSTFELSLTVGKRYEFVTDTSVCSDGPFFWHGKQYVKSGTYTDSLASSLGCDSVFILKLTFIDRPQYSKVVEFCQGDSLYFNGRIIKHSVNIDDTLRALSGCDSIVHYRFNMLPSFYHSDTIYLCAGSDYLWHGQTIRNSGTYWDSLKTISGCDSIFKLTVELVHAQTSEISATICKGESYNLNGQLFYESGTYYDTIYNTQGCADIYKLNLTVNPTYIHNDFVTLCSTEGFWYKGIYIDKPGTYYDSLTTSNGCDSICCIIVNRAANYFFSDTARIYKGATYNFRGRILSKGGTYYDSLKTINGCDSIYQLILYVTPEFHNIEYATICDNEYFDFNGRLLNKSGVYWDSLKTFNNFDSIYELHLTVHPTYITTVTHTDCWGNSINFRGMHITQPGIYYDSLYTVNGCDSVFRLIFNWSNTYLFEDTAIICKGDHYNFRGRDLSHSGLYFDSLKTITGCDSIYQLLLIVKNHFYTELADTICDGDLYNFNGRILTESGIYYDSIKTPEGCDSIYKLTLSKFQSYSYTSFIEQCYGQKWTFRGITIDKPGVYYDSLVSSTGCDSVYKLVFSWSTSYHFYDTVNICEGDYYNFRGRNIYLAGTYYDSLKTSKGCDSIFQVYLNVIKKFHNVETVNICSNEYYNFRGKLINQSGIYTDSLKNSYGCDSVYELHLSISAEYLIPEYIDICQGSTYQYRGITISKPGVYYDSLKTTTGCDSVIKLIVNYSPTYLFVDTASICAGSSYKWRGHDITLSGEHYDSLRTNRGCDSIYKLVLSVVQPFYDVQYVEMCSNEYYNFRGRYLNQSGTYYDTLKSSYGCDSIYELILKIKPHYLIDNYIETCYGNSIIFRGNHITKPGIYYDSLFTHEGCDSIYRLIFTWKSSFLFSDTATICNGSHYNFRGQILSRPGLYYDSLKTVSGCDSIYQLVLKVNPATWTIVDTTLCANDVFILHGERITNSGTYYDTIRSIQGCDSFITYNITINDNYLFEAHTTLCHGSDIIFRGIHITKPGTYYDSMRTIHGCDSVFKLVFNWTPTYLFVDTIHLCNGTTYNFHGKRITGSGTYYDTLKTISGCDSIHKLVVFAGDGFYFEETKSICSNDVYFFHGRRITESGIYWDSLTTISGCDSIYKLTITVDESKTRTINVDLCSNDVYYKSDGTLLNKSGTYYDTLVTSNGCDSIVKIALNVHAAQLFEETKSICKGNYYSWHGRNLTSSGIYWDSLVTIHGCDSVFKLNLTNHTYYTEIDTTLCNNTSFRFNNKFYNTTGIYYDTLPTVLGCDSVFKLDVKINPTYNLIRHLTICDTDFPIPFGKGFVNKTGVYYDTTLTTTGCDSINTLYLTVIQTYYLDEDTMCEDEIYSWHGHQFTQPGLYTDTVRDQSDAHCDIVYALRLHSVQKTYLYSADIAPFICADDIEYSITPRYSGTKPDAYTIRYTSATISKNSDIVNANFSSSPIIIPLPIGLDGDSLRPDSYSGTLEVYNRTCDANPQSIDFTLNIRYPSYIVNQHWNDVIAILNSKYNGGYTFSKYEWYVNDVLLQSFTGSNMYLPNLRIGDKVEVGLTREEDNYAILTCPIWIQDLSNMETSEYPIVVEGTILRNNTQARIIASAEGTYSLYSSTGAIISSGKIPADSETLVNLPPVSGIYFLYVTSNNEPRTFKLLVQ